MEYRAIKRRVIPWDSNSDNEVAETMCTRCLGTGRRQWRRAEPRATVSARLAASEHDELIAASKTLGASVADFIRIAIVEKIKRVRSG